MPGPKPAAIELSEAERAELEQLAKAHSTAQQIALRSRIILAADAGQNNAEIARRLEVVLNTVRLWRERWLTLLPIPLEELSVAERLEDLPRPGAPSGISADQLCQMVALACEAPEKSGRPISHWTGREIADELMKRGIVDTISPRHAQRLFKRSGSQAPSDPLLVNA
jgi:putative transposase